MQAELASIGRTPLWRRVDEELVKCVEGCASDGSPDNELGQAARFRRLGWPLLPVVGFGIEQFVGCQVLGCWVEGGS